MERPSVAEGASLVLLVVVVLERLWLGAVILEETNVVVGFAEMELVLWTASDVLAALSTVEADDVAATALVLAVLLEGLRMLVGLCDVSEAVVVGLVEESARVGDFPPTVLVSDGDWPVVEVFESIAGEDDALDDTVVGENVSAGVERVELALLSVLETDDDDTGGVSVCVATGTV